MKKQINFDKVKSYSLDEAFKLVKENSHAKFDESVEVHIRLGTDPQKSEQQVRATCVLPHGTGKTKRVAVFTQNGAEAKEAGADLVGGSELIEKIRTSGKVDFDVAIAQPETMKELAKIAKILGPKGLMPSPKSETVTTNIKKTIEEMKKGKITFKGDDTSNIHQVIGKVSWSDDKLKENFNIFLEAVRKARPSGVKGDYIKQIVICSTMGPGIKVTL